MKRVAIGAVVFLSIAGALGFLVTSGPSSSDHAGGGVGTLSTAIGGPGESATASGAPVAVVDGVAQPSAGSGSEVLADVGTIPDLGLHIVKTARISLTVPKGKFAEQFDAVTVAVGKYGGYIESSSQSGTRLLEGQMVIRVPAVSFERLFADLGTLGTPTAQSFSGQDVTSQYIDLNARLKTWETQESVMLRLLRRATSLDQTFQIQRQLQDVQYRIEQIRGQLRVLNDQTALATIELSMREPGIPVTPPRRPAASTRPSLAEAWNKALDGMLGVLYAVTVGLGYLVPIAILWLLGVLGYRRLRLRVGPAGTATP